MLKDINIAKVISAKRNEKGITQDQLAEYIGVTKASVSKWETDKSYPDITLLPQLSSFFNISIDELIGYSPQMTKETIKKTYHHLASEFSHKTFNEVLIECRKLIKKYYACFPLLLQIAKLFVNHYMLAKDKEKQEALLQETIDLCRRIKKECDDIWITKQANSFETICHIILNQPLEAIELLDETLKPPISDHFLLSKAYQMTGNSEKAKEVIQVGLYHHLRGILGPAQSYLLLIADKPSKFEQALDRFLQITKVFEVEKLDPNITCLLYLAAAQGYSIQNNQEKALEMLEKYVCICTTSLLPYELKGDSFFDRIDNWLKDYDIEAPRDEKTIRKSILQSVVENPAFISLHNERKYKQIIEKLNRDFIKE
ncbi:helix-turn-helix transcriptional regulator [Pullulanibacillus sp. KACC 23026]|uniref:helix-turn-helix domain-containing protein n=1 Tax=Pullulanibacillus sp. KACC 23026 TaxID=3028315 RepID=UPI0023B19234|nr:helix-turn-helix transcriptional regulator [Pullulanibacillus sp. KACC 23026]WEG14833.1 helix-turn-helix transcriptional regulator [Pullulanibacillus sp. KACC 23026]